MVSGTRLAQSYTVAAVCRAGVHQLAGRHLFEVP